MAITSVPKKARLDPAALDAVMSKAKVDEPIQSPALSSPAVEVVKPAVQVAPAAAPAEPRKSVRKTPLTLTMPQDVIDALDAMLEAGKGRSRAALIERACRELIAKESNKGE